MLRASLFMQGESCLMLCAARGCCWAKKMARQPLPFGAAAGPGWFGPPLIASDAGMDLVSTLARAPIP